MSHGSQVSLHRRLWRHQRQLFQRWNLRQSLEISPWRSQPRWAWHMREGGPKCSVPTWMSLGRKRRQGFGSIGITLDTVAQSILAYWGALLEPKKCSLPWTAQGFSEDTEKRCENDYCKDSQQCNYYFLHHPINHSGIPSFFPTAIKTRCLIDPLVDLHPNQTGGFPGSPTRCRCYDQRSVRYWRYQCIQQGAGRAVDGWRAYMGQNSQAPTPVMANKYYVSCILKFDEIWILEFLMICTYIPYMVRSQCILYVYIC